MIPQLGKDMLLKLDDGKGNFRVVAGLRTAEVSLKERAVDATHAESPKGWRQLLERAGEKSLALAGSGLFTDADVADDVRKIFFDGTLAKWQAVLPGHGRIVGKFKLVELVYEGRHDGEIAYRMTLESADQPAFESE